MNKLIYTLFISVFLVDYLSSELGLLSRYATWIPELLSMLTIFIVSGLFMLEGVKNVPPKVFIFLALFLLNMVIGIFINLVPAGTVIAGFRSYLKFIPFFLLPFVYHFSPQQIQKQLKLLVFLFVIQVPTALYQRIVKSEGIASGDYVKGTLATSSGQLTVILACAIAVLICFYLAKRLTLTSFIVIFFLLFLPMTINETKSTLVLLPVALVLPLYFSSSNLKLKLKQSIPILVFGSLAGIAFILIYDYYITARWGYGLLDFLSMEGRTESYLYKGADPNVIADPHAFSGRVGKIDSFVIAFKILSENILNLCFGLGIGNVSESFIPALSGEYAEEYSLLKVKSTALALILWETGIFGAMLYYALFYMVFKDARYLSQYKDELISTFSHGFSVVIVLLTIASVYTHIFIENTTSYLFWYFSGYIISESFRCKRENNAL